MEYQVQIHHSGDLEIPALSIIASSPAAAAEMALERVAEGPEYLEAIFGPPHVLRPREALETAIIRATADGAEASALVDPPEPPCAGARHAWGDVEGEPPSDSRQMCWECGLIVEHLPDGRLRYTGHQIRKPTTGILRDATISMLLNHRVCGARVHDIDWIRATSGWLAEQWDEDAWSAFRISGLSAEDRRLLREAALDADLPRLLALPLEECEEWTEQELQRMAEARAAAAAAGEE
jgi:hypothetical protein